MACEAHIPVCLANWGRLFRAQAAVETWTNITIHAAVTLRKLTVIQLSLTEMVIQMSLRVLKLNTQVLFIPSPPPSPSVPSIFPYPVCFHIREA